MSQEHVQKIWDLIKDIKFAMLTSEDDGVLRSRPMVASQKDFDRRVVVLYAQERPQGR